MEKRVKIIIIVIAAFIVIVVPLVITFFHFRQLEASGKTKETMDELDTSIPVAVSTVKIGKVRDLLVVTGNVIALKDVSIFSSVPGKIKNILVKEGQRVQKGEVLAYIERNQAGLKFTDAPVESTIKGLVKQVLTQQGQSITLSSHIFQIVDMDFVEVVVNIPEKEISRVRIGLDAEVYLIAYPDKIFSGKIYKLSPVVNPVSRTREAKILVNNKNHIQKPGMFGTVKIIIKEKEKALIIPHSSLINRNNKTILFVIREGKAVEIVPEIDIIHGDNVSVLADTTDLRVEELVVVIGQHNINQGDRVSIIEESE